MMHRMNARVGLAVIAGTLFLAAFDAAARVQPAREIGQVRFAAVAGETEFSGQLIVRVRQGMAPERDAGARARLAGSVLKHYAETDEYVINVAGDVAARDAAGAQNGAPENRRAAELLATGDYQYVHPNWICYPTVVPNDPQYPSQWHHPRIQSPQAWDLLQGRSDVVCAFVDTGIDVTHPDLAAHRVPGFNSVDDLAEVDGGQVNDVNGHGTHVAGDGAAIGNNATGVCGVGWNLRIMMVRTSNASGGGAYLDDILQGARWAVEHGAKVSSASYSGVNNDAVGTTGTYIKSIGGLFLYAAGNSGSNWSSFDFPDTIVVGASDQSDNRAGFSGYGRAVDVFAPGVDILSTTNGGGYGPASGTSMATPVCNGVIGMIWSVNPSFTPQQIEAFLFGGCDDMGPLGEDEEFGWGRVNVFKSVQLAMGAGGQQPPAAVSDSSHAIGTAEVLIDVTANDFDPNGDPYDVTYYSPSTAGAAIQIVAGAGTSGRAAIRYAAPAGFVGIDTFTYTVTDSTNRSGTGNVTVQVYDPKMFRSPDHPAHTSSGVFTSYYALNSPSSLPNFDLLTPIASGVEPEINNPSTGGDFGGSGLSDNVGATYVGYVEVPVTEVYRFYTESDDGSRLLIGDTEVVNNDGLHGMQERSGSIALQAGRHAIRVEFFEAGGGAGIIARIEGGGIGKQVIPGPMWSHDICAADFDQNGFVNGADFDLFVAAFEAGDAGADFDQDGFITGVDFDEYVYAFEAGC